jgi:hypothetical protein
MLDEAILFGFITVHDGGCYFWNAGKWGWQTIELLEICEHKKKDMSLHHWNSLVFILDNKHYDETNTRLALF